MINKEVVVSGIRPTGRSHLGNYLGAIHDFIPLSEDKNKDCFFFVANLHALTTKINPEDIKRDLLEMVLDFVSVGINPNTSKIFAQSSVPETCELAWLLNCLSSTPDLERMPHFKDKKDKLAPDESINAGLLVYPVLMAADILGPQANLVPVGEDQHPHMEFTRELARKFNMLFGETFPVPKLLEKSSVRVPGLDGKGKMGKSDNNMINLSDSPKIVNAKIMQAVTDPNRKRRSDSGDPLVCNIFSLHSLVSDSEDIKNVCDGCKKASIGCVDCKKILVGRINNILMPIQQRRAELGENSIKYALEILEEGGKNARKVISKTVELAKERMGVPFY